MMIIQYCLIRKIKIKRESNPNIYRIWKLQIAPCRKIHDEKRHQVRLRSLVALSPLNDHGAVYNNHLLIS
jgi:hypothetical protein